MGEEASVWGGEGALVGGRLDAIGNSDTFDLLGTLGTAAGRATGLKTGAWREGAGNKEPREGA